MTEQKWAESMDGSKPKVLLYHDSFLGDDIDSPAAMGDGGVIIFQHGPLQEVGPNGTTIEVVIQALIAQLRGFNENPIFRCRENSLAIMHLEEALHWLWARSKNRQEQGVEGKNIPHKS